MSGRRSGRRAAAALMLAAGLMACNEDEQSPLAPAIEPQLHLGAPQRSFQVYTQNLYLGGDTGPLFTLDFGNIPAVIGAVNTFWQQVQNSAVPERMAEVVDEIAARRPDVVGLQEVLRFVVLDGSGQATGVVDLLAEIEAGLAARGLNYVVEAVQPGTSATLPMGFDPQVGLTKLLNFTDRVVVLRRADVEVTATAKGRYAASFPIATTPLGTVELVRGWIRTSVEHHGVPHHFVTTHLEVQTLAPIQAAQLDELLGSVVAGLEGVTIITGDLNSDAEAEEGAPSWTPTYDQLVAAGFEDVWDRTLRSRWNPGFTCCQALGLNQPSELDERIDFVLARGSGPHVERPMGVRGYFRGDIVGEEPSDLTPSGLWPSDHAGIVAELRVRRGPPSVRRGPKDRGPHGQEGRD